ncbi:MAG TPA: LPS assembly lipoprotein LptE [Roseiarcus sp.]|nr:LPS assembly lipoprotein LptE [Roseiarcus sp.]
MSWSDAARLAGAMAIAASLGGCFQPLYGEAAHPGLVEDMRAIQIAEVNPPNPGVKPNAVGLDPQIARQDRVGHYLRNDLIFNFNGTGTTPPPKYRLSVTTTETTTTPTIESQIGAADAATLTIKAVYVLTPVGGGAPILSSEAVSSAVYDLSMNRFANLRASRDAEIRLAKSLADEMELRIAAALAEKRGS